MLMLVLLMLASSCKKDDTTPSLSKTDPVITWANPADIGYGTLLSATQLNATANVPGSFIYTPASGTILNVGTNQDLKVVFTPTDAAAYNSISKTVKINVNVSSWNVIIFNPNLSYGTVTDIDGNVYKTITIGLQTWMAENLRTTKYCDGSAIPEVTDGMIWGNLTTGAYCNYNNTSNSDAIATYGRLYNWYALNDSRKLAPSGWHVATVVEWNTLTDNLGGYEIAGGKLKETGTTHWYSPNEAATNVSGFTALPGGYRYYDGTFHYIGNYGFWWSSSEHYTSIAWYRHLDYNDGDFGYNIISEVAGFSVRCVKDI